MLVKTALNVKPPGVHCVAACPFSQPQHGKGAGSGLIPLFLWEQLAGRLHCILGLRHVGSPAHEVGVDLTPTGPSAPHGCAQQPVAEPSGYEIHVLVSCLPGKHLPGLAEQYHASITLETVLALSRNRHCERPSTMVATVPPNPPDKVVSGTCRQVTKRTHSTCARLGLPTPSPSSCHEMRCSTLGSRKTTPAYKHHKHTVKWLKWERPHAGCSCGPSIKGVSCHEMRVSVRGSVSLF